MAMGDSMSPAGYISMDLTGERGVGPAHLPPAGTITYGSNPGFYSGGSLPNSTIATGMVPPMRTEPARAVPATALPGQHNGFATYSPLALAPQQPGHVSMDLTGGRGFSQAAAPQPGASTMLTAPSMYLASELPNYTMAGSLRHPVGPAAHQSSLYLASELPNYTMTGSLQHPVGPETHQSSLYLASELPNYTMTGSLQHPVGPETHQSSLYLASELPNYTMTGSMQHPLRSHTQHLQYAPMMKPGLVVPLPTVMEGQPNRSYPGTAVVYQTPPSREHAGQHPLRPPASTVATDFPTKPPPRRDESESCLGRSCDCPIS
eukprot:TRINITY_DN16162_c0_g1_i1.p1 TRINITY_DN16162_c0_g1~~TRINITY_DN16162_c0_g1_i1.p1  ORF type:complete len:336 (-),score=16.42 TRINITY_DN16162_c0_g1_i1:139-1095(-)